MIKTKISSFLIKINQFSQKYPVVFPLTLLAFALITYGLFIFSLGFYWDDWPPILLSHIGDPTITFEYWSYDRPFQSWTYYLLFPICRDSTFLWQLSAILARWTAALTLYFTFTRVFPRQKNLLQWAAVLFVVFPGFADQYASVSYGSHFLVYTVFGLSLLFMVLAVQKPSKFWLFFPIALIFTIAHLFSMEYFVGLELLRPLLLIFLFVDAGNKKNKAIGKALLNWLPYLGIFAFYIIWRMKIYPNWVTEYSGSNYPYLITNFLKAPADTLINFLQTVYSDLRFLLLDIWTDRILPVTVEFKSMTFWLSLLIGIGAAAVLHLFFKEKEDAAPLVLKGKEILRNSLLFLVVFFFGMFPVWSTLRQITKGKWSDRFDIPVMFAVAILLLTVIYIVIQNAKTRNIFLILITGLSISFQIQTANEYRKDFNRQEEFYSQLAWRIPTLNPGSMLYSPGIPSGKEADYSFSMGINLLYSDEVRPELDYWFYGPRYMTPEDLISDPNIVIEEGLRNLKFKGLSSNTVSIFKGDGCLLVLDPYYALIPEGNTSLAVYGDITNQDLIDETVRETTSISKIIDVNPQNSWCYYFEKADLARSKGNFAEAVGFYETAVEKGHSPLESIEYLPFIQSYAELGQIDIAVELTEKSFTKSGYSKPSLCQFWQDFLAEHADISLAVVDSVYNSKNCSILNP